jgi:hypothetical protein
MANVLLLCVAIVFWSGSAGAAPNDFHVVDGKIVYERSDLFIVKTEAGATYYVDIRGAARSQSFKLGDMVSVIGYEGSRADEMRAALLEAPRVTATSATATPLIAGGLSLPQSHQYEVYDRAVGRYTPVDVSSVAAHVERGEWVFDRTANEWVHHPSVGKSAKYVAPEAVVQGGFTLPRSHRFEVYDRLTGRYNEVEVGSVATRIEGGEWVFDRTANEWVHHPSVGKSTKYLTPENLVQGGFTLPRSHRYEIYDRTTGQYTEIEPSAVVAKIEAGEWVFDRTAGVWVTHPSVGRNSQYLTGSAAAPSTAKLPASAPGQWVRLRGTVERVDGASLTLKTDEGRSVVLDIAQARQHLRGSLDPGDRVSVLGFGDPAASTLVARTVRTERSELGRDDPSWQRVRGQVQSLQGSTMRFRSDEGRILQVDLARLGADAQRAVRAGERATLIGSPGPGAGQFRVEYIQTDGSGSASPRMSNEPTRKSDCHEGGWSRFRNPTFRNQAECLGYVEGRR